MSDVHPVPTDFAAHAAIKPDDYARRYAQSIADPEAFWAKIGQRLEWMRAPTRIKDVSFDPHDFHIRWYADGVLNACANCLDRHLQARGDKTAIIFEADDPVESRRMSYRELHAEVCQFANALRHLGVERGDRVAIYLPMIPEAAVAMLACARIGAIHVVVFSGFSAAALADRLVDAKCKLVITADEGMRGGKRIPLKVHVDEALTRRSTNSVETVILVRRTGGSVNIQSPRDRWYADLIDGQSRECPPEPMQAEDPLFILYTSGTTGKPQGVLHTTGGYLVFASCTHAALFDLKDDDVCWCTIDLGWIAGHSYALYGPLANGATTVLFEGAPHRPDAGRLWRVVDRHAVSVLATAPSVIRRLMEAGDAPVRETSRRSLRVLGAFGEPLDAPTWEWYFKIAGDERCPVVDAWEQTEGGGAMIATLPGALPGRAGSVGKPFFGVVPAIVDAHGKVLEGACAGNLVLADSWPGQMRTIYGNEQGFIDTCFKPFPGFHYSGDGARRDADGYYWITGRVDSVINVSGHRLASVEVERALIAQDAVAEAAVVGFPDARKGQGIYAFVTLAAGIEPADALRRELVEVVRTRIGPIATIDYLQWAPALPKTRAGEVVRSILRKIAANDIDSLGESSALADPLLVKRLVDARLVK